MSKRKYYSVDSNCDDVYQSSIQSTEFKDTTDRSLALVDSFQVLTGKLITNVCHKCGYSGRLADCCPQCGSTAIKHLRRVSGYLAEKKPLQMARRQ